MKPVRRGRSELSESDAGPASAGDKPSHVVGIGASAGGLAALQLLLGRFTLDTTAFVVGAFQRARRVRRHVDSVSVGAPAAQIVMLL